MNPPFQASSLTGVSTLLFDLGQVIINLDFNATETAFKNIYGADYHRFKSESATSLVFEHFETGHIDQASFLQELNNLSPGQIDPTSLIQAWNAMLLDIPLHRLEMLSTLGQHFQIMLLSNTNSTHLEHVHAYLKTTYNITDWEDRYFDKAYYSHLMGLRKPNPEIYEAVLNENHLNPHEVLFIDDNFDNIESAKKLGIQTLHHQPEQDITSIFQNFL